METQQSSVDETQSIYFVPQLFHISSPHQSNLKDAIFSIGAPASVWAKKHDWVYSRPFDEITISSRSPRMPLIRRFDRLHKLIKTKKLTGNRINQPEFTDHLYYVGVKSGELENEEELLEKFQGEFKSLGQVPENVVEENAEKTLQGELSSFLRKRDQTINRFASQNDDLKSHLIIYAKLTQKLQIENNGLKMENEELNKTLSFKNDQINEQKSLSAEMKTENRHLLELYKISTLGSKQMDLQKLQIDDYKERIADSEQVQSELQTKNFELMQRVKILEAQNEELQSQSKIYQMNQSMAAELGMMKSMLHSQQQILIRLEKENTELKGKLWDSRVAESLGQIQQ